MRGARTFMVKVKAHRGEPLNERADSQAENARQLPPECRQWTTRTSRMTYEWSDNGVKHVRGRKQSEMQCSSEELNSKGRRYGTELPATGVKSFYVPQTSDRHESDIRSARIRQVACTGIKCDLIMDSTRWGWECMLQLQEVEDRKPPKKQRGDELSRLLRAHSHVGSGYT